MRQWIDLVEQPLMEVTRPDDRWIATEILKRSGWEVIGSGAFASIYAKEDVSYVLKLFDADDAAYLAFLHLVQKYPMVNFPRLIGRPIPVSKGFHAIRMERLSPYRGDPELFRFYMTGRDLDYESKGYMADKMSDVEELFYGEPTLKVALDLIIDNLLPQFRCDIRPCNIMVRGSTIVFTDPVANQNTGHAYRDIIPVPYRQEKIAPKPPSQKFNDLMRDDELLKQLIERRR